MVRWHRVAVAVLLAVAGALMIAASWQRWSGVCEWAGAESRRCLARQDHRFDIVAPAAPWEPIGESAQLAGCSLMVLAVAFALLPRLVTGRRPEGVTVAATAAVVLAQAVVGAATLSSGLTDGVVQPLGYGVAVSVWFFGAPALLVGLAVVARGWARATVVWLLLATPLVAALSYAVGPYDAQPWWEAVSGLLVVSAGLCLLAAAAFGNRSPAGARGRRLRDGRPVSQVGAGRRTGATREESPYS